MIVVDVGCAKYGGKHDSLERLLEMFDPVDELYGFDPNLEGLREAAWWLPKRDRNEPLLMNYGWQLGDTRVYLKGVGVSTYDGQIGFRADGLNGWTAANTAYAMPLVPCIDLARFLEELPEGPVVLKMDAEGAEYPVLLHLWETGADARLTKALIEWHGDDDEHLAHNRELLERKLRTELEVWPW